MRAILFLLSGILCLSLTGCGTSVPKTPSREGPLLWPSLPEQPRYVYEAVLRDSESIRVDSEADRMRQLIAGTRPTRASFSKPLAIAARAGRIYVTDTEARRVYVFDVPRRRFFSFGHRLEGELKKPAGIAVDRRGHVYVADVTARRIVVYDALGLYVRTMGDAATLQRPTGVAVSPDGDRVYAIDAGGVDVAEQHRVAVFDDRGRFQHHFGRRGGRPGEFNLPVDGVVAADGTLYVLDAGNFRVQAFDAQGRFLRSFGEVGSAPGQFARPRGIAVDPSGNVYVTDALLCNVQVFDPTGRLLLALGGRGSEDAPGRYLLPAGIAVDETRRVYVVDQYFHKIEVLRGLSEEEGRRLQAGAR